MLIAGTVGRFPEICLGKRQGPRLQPGKGCRPAPPLLRHCAVLPLEPSRQAARPRVAARGRCTVPRAPAPLHWPLLPSSAPLDSFPSAPWAHRSRLRTGSYSGASRGSCCRLRGGGNGGCGGDSASGRASGESRARPGSPSSASARYLGPSRWTPQSPGRLSSARVYGMEAGPSGAGKGPRGLGAVCIPKPYGLSRHRAWLQIEERCSQGMGGPF